MLSINLFLRLGERRPRAIIRRCVARSRIKKDLTSRKFIVPVKRNKTSRTAQAEVLLSPGGAVGTCLWGRLNAS